MKKANNFQTAKIQSQSFAYFFCQFEPDVADKSVAYKKACNLDVQCTNVTQMLAHANFL